MAKKARDKGLSFRPHFKTHQSAAIGQWFFEEGVRKITVSSVEMAKYFAARNWNDILIAFPLNLNELDEINTLAEKIDLHLTLENEEGLEFLKKHLKYPVNIYLKIDAGYGRTGIKWTNTSTILNLAKKIKNIKKITLKGLIVHSGHTYHANSTREIIQIHNDSIEKLSDIKKQLNAVKKDIIISIGDTPGCSLAENFENVDEIRPGNFVFYDLQQYKLNACSLENIAVCLACPIVAKHEDRNEFIIYGGAVHFSKEYLMEGDLPVYGYGVKMSEEDWIPRTSRMLLTKLSQEHGTVTVTPEAFKEFKIGDFIGFLPVHSCLTANLMGEYMDFEGNTFDHMNGK